MKHYFALHITMFLNFYEFAVMVLNTVHQHEYDVSMPCVMVIFFSFLLKWTLTGFFVILLSALLSSLTYNCRRKKSRGPITVAHCGTCALIRDFLSR